MIDHSCKCFTNYFVDGFKKIEMPLSGHLYLIQENGEIKYLLQSGNVTASCYD
jgi:hypothetical protein